ncbi:hypothetical protein SCOR_06720 [Sulfidibacter corallicola]|uniref:Uncharacterized protein n=1 Tax=Sulfidibacter corallicola TaxID=2818388 RepID=A0A8A4TNH6_SULCO|nr:hypothetical protein [Sulfidibacter corallicola]QTD51539.1 hypothetical protein J3U87_03640 [Sulfidibacter corallicola]
MARTEIVHATDVESSPGLDKACIESLEEIIRNGTKDNYYSLFLIYGRVMNGTSLEDAVHLFATDDLRSLYARGFLEMDGINRVLNGESRSFPMHR